MWMVWIGAGLIVLKLAGVSVFATLSWWWVALPFAAAAIWFQIDERLGLRRRRAMDEVERAKRDRIRNALDRKSGLGSRR